MATMSESTTPNSPAHGSGTPATTSTAVDVETRRGVRFPTRWTAISSALVVLLCVLALIIVPIPFVARSPGQTVNLISTNEQSRPMIQIDGLTTRHSEGEVRMTTVSITRADARLSLAEALVDHSRPDHDVLERETIYPPGRSVQQVNDEESYMMDTSQRDAAVAALRAAGQPVTEMPMVSAVSAAGPAHGKLKPGDLIEKVDGKPAASLVDVGKAVREHAVGDTVVFMVLRGSAEKTIAVTTVSSVRDRRAPAVGITVDTGYRYAPTITYAIPEDIGGPSAGLAMALSIYQMVAPNDLIGSLRIAATGSISPDGNVIAIGGIQEKIAGAERDGSKIFLVPAGNCRDVSGFDTSVRLVKVSSLKDAIAAIQKIRRGGTGVPHC
ncbi:PDZ domain-containing protein [Cutibacterium equinum]|uniref:PDZ domain-containing protein n=1 Tax=Cutibacterium equinum TaxID=3016342 RepID=A0ABY7QXI4_9ACTN|nr:S16 family serine protease [Cutibacterium equinum]WCC79098.1 PDZ domain-containing protein [Cutibacterium equinum]